MNSIVVSESLYKTSYLSPFIFGIIRNAGLPHRKAFTRNFWKEFVVLSFTTGTKEQTLSIPVPLLQSDALSQPLTTLLGSGKHPDKTQQMIKSELKTDYQDMMVSHRPKRLNSSWSLIGNLFNIDKLGI